KAIAEYSTAIDRQPRHADAWLMRGIAHFHRGRYDEASADFAQRLKLTPDALETTYAYAAALVLSGDAEGYRRRRARLLERAKHLRCGNRPGRKSYLLARICLLAPDAVPDPDQVLQLAEEAVRAERDSHELHTLGLAHYRAGRHDESIKLFHESMKADARW